SVLASAIERGDKLASVRKGTVLAAKGKLGAFYRVEWQKGRTGFLPAAAAKEAPGARANNSKVVELMQSEPPSIKLANVDTSRGGVETEADHFPIAGSAADLNGIGDSQM